MSEHSLYTSIADEIFTKIEIVNNVPKHIFRVGGCVRSLARDVMTRSRTSTRRTRIPNQLIHSKGTILPLANREPSSPAKHDEHM